MVTLGQKLRKAREKKGWSQTLVCNKLGISNSGLSGYERDYREPDTETLKKLADIYEVSIDWLLGRDKQEYEDPELDLWFKELKEASPERREELKRFWDFIKEKEKERKPGDKQGEDPQKKN